MDFKDKKVLVCGMARSGVSAARLLNAAGASVTLQDRKERQEFDFADELEKEGVKLYTGKNPDDIVSEQSLIIVSPGISSDLPFIKKAKEENIPVWSEIELGYRFTSRPICAITGTNGKTTTTALTGEIFKTKYPNTDVAGNIGVPFTAKVGGLNKDDYVVAELSSFQLENIIKFRPKISAVLNVTPDHLDRHKTMDGYVSAKERIFENQTESDFIILNYEDEYCRKMADKTKARAVFFSSARKLDEGIFLDGGNIIIKYNGLNETLIHTDELKILGAHNHENAMAAVAAAVCAGVDVENIRKALKAFKGVEHRIEFVAEIDGVEYYNDSKGTNPDAAIKAVLAMKRPIVLIGGGYDKKSNFDEWTKTFNGRVKKLVLIGVTADEIKRSAEKNGFTDIIKADSFEEAVAVCKKEAKAGDCVLLSPACASWDMFKSYEQRGEIFKTLALKADNK